MFTRQNMFCLSCLAWALVGLALFADADEADKDLMDATWHKWKEAGKNPVPVYSRGAKTPGLIKIAANGRKVVGSQDVVAWTPIGWCQNCTWPLNERDVFFNVSDAGAAVRVGELFLKPGESAVCENGTFQPMPGNVSGQFHGREWTDSTGRYKVEAEFVVLHEGNARLKRRDGKTVDVPLSRLSRADRDWIETTLNTRDGNTAKTLAANSRDSGLEYDSRTDASLRGWAVAGTHWLAVSVPLSVLPKRFTLSQCEVRRGESTVAKAIGVVPPAGSVGSIAGDLAVGRDNSPLRVGAHELRPSKELEDPSKGIMRLSVTREVPFEEMSLSQFRVASTLVVGSDLQVQVDRDTVFIPPTSDTVILTEYGWRIGLSSSNSRSGIRFKRKAEAAIDILFAIVPSNAHALTLDIGSKRVGALAIAD